MTTSKQSKQSSKAHYFKSSKGCSVIISQDSRPIGYEIAVKGKAEARKVAKQHDAEPWNF